MEELIELLSQIQELAGIGIEALSGALQEAGGGAEAPPGEGGLPPDETLPPEGPPV